MTSGERYSFAAETALSESERSGFRLAVIGRTCALAAVGAYYLAAYRYPSNLSVAGVILAIAAVGLLPLWLTRGPYERISRYALFTIDAVFVSSVLLAPLSSGGDIPQNFVFHSSRTEFPYLLLAISILTLSPGLVLWTGFCLIVGLAGATAWIVAGMDQIVSYGHLPPAPSREQVMAVVLSPHFLGIPVRVIEGVVLAVVTCIAALAVHRGRNVVRAHAAAEAERTRIQQLFGRYVPREVVEEIIHAGQLAPQQREASVLFIDIQGFTRMSELLSPSQVIGLVNCFFAAATTLINENSGVVVNHVGDGLIASFNAPLPTEAHAARAIGTARALLELVQGRDFEGHNLRVRIGIATGPVATGTVGGAGRETFTLYGDTVNLAQRLEELNKETKTACLISEETFKAAEGRHERISSLGLRTVRGRDKAIEVFALA